MSNDVVSRIHTADALDARLTAGRSAFVGYLPVGFPTLATSIDAAKALIDGGADVVELGLAYSDPSMDGPVIQHATTVALANGIRTRDVMAAVEEVSDYGHDAGAAVVVMTYWNPVLQYGPEAFARDLAAAGGAGLITPDLTPDSGAEWIAAADAHGLDKVFLVAPSSTDTRLKLTVDACRGFVYAASLMGVTGERAEVGAAAAELVRRTRAAGAERVCVGLGVTTPSQAAEVASFADGVIVGTALVRALMDDPGPDGGIARVRSVARGLSDAIASVEK